MSVVTSSVAEVDCLVELHRQGMYLDAYQTYQSLPPLSRWAGPENRIFAGRLAMCWGGRRLGQLLHRLAYREYPCHPGAIYYQALGMYHRVGALRTYHFLQSHGELNEAATETRANWLALHGRVFAAFRDFERADAALRQAEELAPEQPWIQIEKASVLFAQDRHDAALEAARHALTLRPWYRPSVQSTAYFLTQLNCEHEALELLSQAADRIQSGEIVLQLAALQTELEMYPQARESWERAAALLPLAEEDERYQAWLAARRSDAAYYVGDYAAAAEAARQAGGEFFGGLAQRLRSGQPQGQRVALPVGFVRQHHDTCAPATLTMLSQYWGKTIDHWEVVERICYDGTPSHRERQWALDNGFVAREFRVTWESAVALIDRGIPFTLTTVGTGKGHLQAVVGYDACRHTFLIRDPSERHSTEYVADELLTCFSSTGPRGMAIVPQPQRPIFDQLSLADAELYDLYFDLTTALQVHDRDRATSLLQAMRDEHTEHRLTWHAALALARYDADLAAGLQCVDRLLGDYPEDTNLLLARLEYLSQLGRRAARTKLLGQITARDACDPMFELQLSRDLLQDAREHDRAEALLESVLRACPTDAHGLSALAELRWRQEDREAALDLYRLAACVSDKDEYFSGTYFSASRFLRRTDEALQFLRDRQQRFGARSTWPARTLADAYERGGQVTLALETLEESLERHPDDGEFLLHAAKVFAKYGDYRRSQAILEKCENSTHPIEWLRANAHLASSIGRSDAALAVWQRILQAEPLAIDAHQHVAELLIELNGSEAAVAHLQQAVRRFPHCIPLGQSLVEVLAGVDVQACEQALQHYLQNHLDDAWAHRELALCLLRQNRRGDVEPVLERAMLLAPNSPAVHFVAARLHEGNGDVAAARESHRQALRLAIDYEPSMEALMELCDTKADRVVELRFLLQQFRRQVIFGDTLFAFRGYATGILPETELHDTLAEVLHERPDLWQTWATMALHLSDCERHEEAQAVAAKMVARFPLLSSCWLYLARIQQASRDGDGQIRSLARALEINPTWTMASRELADAYLERKDFTRAEEILAQAIKLEPGIAQNYGCLAAVQWTQGRRQAAIDSIKQALSIEPGYEWAWQALQQWGDETGSPQLAIELARELAAQRPHEARSWYMLACRLDDDSTVSRQECLHALDQALSCNPRLIDAYSMKAWVLLTSGRHEEALAACRPAVLGPEPPLQLQAREAEVVYHCVDRRRGIQLMHATAARDPDYSWAWEKLVQWQCAANEGAAAVEAALELTRIAPRTLRSWYRLGQAYHSAERGAEAETAFARAAELDPANQTALEAYLDSLLTNGKVEAASELLHLRADLLGDVGTISWQIRAAVQQEDELTALAQLGNLCVMPGATLDDFRDVLGAMIEASWLESSARVLGRQLQNPSAVEDTFAAFGLLAMHGQLFRQLDEQFQNLADDAERWLLLSLAALQEGSLSEATYCWATGHIQRHRERLAADLRTWLAIGEMHLAAGKPQRAADWYADWRGKPELQPQMLVPPILTHWLLGDQRRAELLVRHAKHLPGTRLPELQVWMALHEYLNGRVAAAIESLGTVRLDLLGSFYQLLFRMLQAILECPEAGAGYRTVRQRLDRVYQTCEAESCIKLLGLLHARCQLQLARQYGRPLAAAHALVRCWNRA